MSEKGKTVIKQQMDPRCPRGLKCFPGTWCPLAVLRLKAMRNADHEISQEEEDRLPGCPWAVDHQMSNYCFFKFMDEYAGDKPLSDIEIASLNNLSVETVKKTEKIALTKMKEHSTMATIKDDSSPAIEEKDGSSYTIIK
jgi:hypothetical protein